MPAHVLDTIDPAALGTQLMEARRARGLTQQAVADALNVARTTVVAMEKGDRRPRASPSWCRLAALYGRTVGDLVRATSRAAARKLHRAVQGRANPRVRCGAGREARGGPSANLRTLCRDYADLERITSSPPLPSLS